MTKIASRGGGPMKWTIFNGWTKWKSWKFSFSCNARIHRSRHRASDCCHAMPWRQQPRTAQARGAWMTRQHTEDRQLYNRTFPTSRAHRGSLSKRRELVLSSLPTRPLFSPSLGPQSLTLRVSFPCICSPPVCIICSVTSLSLATTTWTPEHPFFSTHCYPNASSDITCISLYLLSTCMYHMFSHITFLGYNHMNSRASVLLDSLLSERIIRYHMCPWGRLIPGYRTRFFLQRGCCCQGKEVVSVDHIRGKGSVPVVPLGRKLVWQPVLSRAPKDPHLAV